MLLTADWVLPVDAPPLRDGAVLLAGGRISRIGPREEFADVPARLPRFDFPGCALVPGLVNAHTHLSLSVMHELLPSAEFATWLSGVPPLMEQLSMDDLADSVAFGAQRCLAGGVTVVGDIAYGPEAPAVAGDTGLGGVFYWEVLGIPERDLRHRLHAAEFPVHDGAHQTGRVRLGISPHSPYTSGPALLQAASKIAHERRIGFAVHVAESPAETQLTREGTGPLADLAYRLAEGFHVPHTTPVRYLADLGVLDDALAVHCVHLPPNDIRTLAERVRGVALCPLSNRYLHNGMPPITALARTGVPLGIGTDSLASNVSLDLFAEARLLRELDGTLTPERLLQIMTLEGARALGVDDAFGSLTPGKQADVVAVRVGPTRHPAAAVLDASAGAVDSVASGGTWRIREGRPVMSVTRIENAIRRISQRLRASAKEGQDS